MLFTDKKMTCPLRIHASERSPLCLLLLLGRDTPRAVRTWRGNCLYDGRQGMPLTSDVLICCDHLYTLPGDRPVRKAYAEATHRLTVFEVPRMRAEARVLWSCDLDLVGQTLTVGHRYARRVTDQIAAKLLVDFYDRIDWGETVDTALVSWLGPTYGLLCQTQPHSALGSSSA